LLLLLSGELAVRWFWDDPVERWAADSEGPTLASVDAPNLEGRFHGMPIRTNQFGFRGPDLAEGAQPSVRRVVVTGDSFVMGWGVEERDAYPSRLERRLRERGTATYEVVNAGLLDINIDQAMDRLQRAIDAYAPQVVVYGATLNDIVGPHYRATYPALKAMGLALHYRAHESSPSHLLRFLWPRWVALEQRWSPSLDYGDALRRNYFENEAAWADYTAALDRFAEMARRHGACGFVLVHTNLNELDAGHRFLDIYARIEGAALARGLAARTTFPLHEGRRPLDLKLSISDGHPNAEGHALLAEALLEGIEALPERCWHTAAVN
jgi:lysophospholipase L1-like esterase